MREVKMFKSFGAASKYQKACGETALRLRVAGVYVVVPDASTIDGVEMVAGDGGIAGFVTFNHLARLGNANHAVESKDSGFAGRYEFVAANDIPGSNKVKLAKKRVAEKGAA